MRSSSPLRHFSQGLLMGAADIVPGVSGGTIALIVGIYERVVDSIRALAKGKVRDVEWALVLPLGIGVLIALGVGSAFIPGLLERYPAPTRAVFFGFIAGSVPIPWSQIREPNSRRWALAAVGAVAAFFLVGLPARDLTDPAAVRVFASAMVAICAMILPGVSGAFLLLVLGLYEHTLRALSDLDVGYIVTFGLGAVVGLALFSRVLGYLLDHRHDATMAVLVGLMAGSLRMLWPWLGEDRGLLPPPDPGDVLVGLVLAAIGFVVVRGLLRLQSEAPEDWHTPPPAE